jgi:Beta-lactamase superfamily domain
VARPRAEEAVTVYDKDGLKISAFLVNHDPVEPAYGYRIEYGGRAAVVSGDTARVQNMVRFSKGADVLVHEALDRYMVEMLASALDASCSVIDAAPSKDLKVLGDRHGFGSRAQAETALKSLNCKALPG